MIGVIKDVYKSPKYLFLMVASLIFKTQKRSNLIPTTSIFPDIDTDRIARDLNLLSEGKKSGLEGLPAKAQKNFDPTEHSIVEKISFERRRGLEEYEEHIKVYKRRLAQASETRIGVEIAVGNAKTNFESAIRSGRNNLQIYRKKVNVRKIEFDRFRKKNNLEFRGLVERWSLFLSLVLLLTAIVIDAIFNSYFFGKISDQGYFGGIMVAGILSIVNVVVSTIMGFFSRYFNHVNLIKKFIGVLVGLFWIGFLILYNLAVAHFRDSATSLVEGFETQSSIYSDIWQESAKMALETLIFSPTTLSGVESWLLVIVGAVISFTAFWKGALFDDPYPGYGRVWKRHEEVRTEYAQRYDQEQQDLISLRDESTEELSDEASSAEQIIGDAVDVVYAKTGLESHLKVYLEHCDQAVSKLLSVYREANLKYRPIESEPPTYFNKPYKFETYKTQPNSKKTRAATTEVEKINKAVENGIKAIFDKCSEAIESFEEIDDIENRNA